MTIRLKRKFPSTTEDRDYCTNSDVTMATEFWQPYFQNSNYFSKKRSFSRFAFPCDCFRHRYWRVCLSDNIWSTWAGKEIVLESQTVCRKTAVVLAVVYRQYTEVLQDEWCIYKLWAVRFFLTHLYAEETESYLAMKLQSKSYLICPTCSKRVITKPLKQWKEQHRSDFLVLHNLTQEKMSCPNI